MKTIQLNNKHYIEGDVVMLPTDKAENSLLLLNLRDGKHLEYHKDKLFTQDYLKSMELSSHHLYITSDEEIKEERLRWIMDKRDGMNNFIHQVSVILDPKLCPEIIATTDKSLIIDYDYHWDKTVDENKKCYNKPLPQLLESFIKEYIEKHNSGEREFKVLIETIPLKVGWFNKDETIDWHDYRGIYSLESYDVTSKEFKPKTNPDNTVNIIFQNEEEKKYSRSEVHSIVRDVCNVLGVDSQYANDYIKENLK